MRDSDGNERPWHPMPDWLKTAASIIIAAVAGYMAIKVDLARTMLDVDYLKQTAARHEANIERLREISISAQRNVGK